MLLLQVALASYDCSNDQDCNIGVASILCKIALILWVIAGGLTLRMQERTGQEFRPAMAVPGAASVSSNQEQVKQKMINLNGTMTVITTLTVPYPDRIRTVKETTGISIPIEASIEVDGMTVDPLWGSIVTSGNLPVRILGRNQEYEELNE